jgi:6-phosphofructokinase 1
LLLTWRACAQVGIVTVGGLCPGLNDIIRALVQSLETFGVPDGHILGIRYGFRGFYETREHPPVVLNSEAVDSIHLAGGTVLGTSRGGSDVGRIVDGIAALDLSLVFVIGGNGGNAAVDAIHQECMRRDMGCAVAGLPKSIDNDILLIDSCFGFNTAVGEAVRAIRAANVEARSMRHGVGLVKLMGRQSGFIAAQAAIASGEVDVCLVPEAPFKLERVLAYIYDKLRTRGHCTVVVAEGAAQEQLRAELAGAGGAVPADTDASGNPVLLDVGRWLKGKIKGAAQQPGADGSGGIVPDIKYFEPAYMIRSVPAGTVDKVYCRMLSHNAVHGAFAGYSGFTAGVCSQHYVFLPAAEVVRNTRRIDTRGRLYRTMRDALRMPELN